MHPGIQPFVQCLTRPRRRLLPLLLLLLTAGCQRPEDPVAPDPLLPKPQLVRLLTGLHLLEARVDGGRLSPDSARALFEAQKRILLQQARTTDTIFQRSYRYYGAHGPDLDEVYKGVVDSLERQERQLEQAAGLPAQDAKRQPRHN